MSVCSVVVLFRLVAENPVAKHPVPGTHANPASQPKAMTFGLGSTVQDVPFQFSMYGAGVVFCPLASLVAPVAQQLDASRHVTVVRMLAGVDGSRLGVVLHVDPFQWSTSEEEGFPLASMVVPTAQQLDDSVQVTAVSS